MSDIGGIFVIPETEIPSPELHVSNSDRGFIKKILLIRQLTN